MVCRSGLTAALGTYLIVFSAGLNVFCAVNVSTAVSTLVTLAAYVAVRLGFGSVLTVRTLLIVSCISVLEVAVHHLVIAVQTIVSYCYCVVREVTYQEADGVSANFDCCVFYNSGIAIVVYVDNAKILAYSFRVFNILLGDYSSHIEVFNGNLKGRAGIFVHIAVREQRLSVLAVNGYVVSCNDPINAILSGFGSYRYYFSIVLFERRIFNLLLNYDTLVANHIVEDLVGLDLTVRILGCVVFVTERSLTVVDIDRPFDRVGCDIAFYVIIDRQILTVLHYK